VIPPTTNFKTLERKTDLLELMSDAAQMFAKRGFHRGANAVEGELFTPSVLCGRDHSADDVGQFGRRTQVHGALPAAVAIAERVVGPVSTCADGTPRANDGSLANEKVWAVGQEVLDAGEFSVSHDSGCSMLDAGFRRPAVAG
jgi:hypothetical protein